MPIAVVAVLALLEITAAAESVATYREPIGYYGFLVGKDAAFRTIAPESPAARAGIVRGDQLVYPTLPLRGRRVVVFQEEVPGGAPITFQIVHDGRSRRLTLRAASANLISSVETLTYALAGLAVGLVGLVLVLVRPSLMTWSFALIAPALLTPWSVIFWSQVTSGAAATLVDALVAISYAVQNGAIMRFASRFPDDRPRGVALFVDRLSVPFAVVAAGVYLFAYMTVRFSTNLPHTIWLADYAIVVPAVAPLVALIWTYATTPGAARSRLVPVLASLGVLIVTGLLQQIGTELTANQIALFSFGIAFAASPALVAAAVAYGVVRHRVMDVSFIVSRTLVYTLLTLGAVATFTLIEYIFGRLLEHQGVATILNILAAVGLGVSFNVVHGRIDTWIDSVLFRQRHAAERRLHASARSLPNASGAATIDAALVDEPVDALKLASAALFRSNGTGFNRIHASGWNDDETTQLDVDDPLVLALRTDLEAIDPHDVRASGAALPNGERQPIYAVPVLAGRQLEAIALYGAHATGEDLDPDERSTLRQLAGAAGVAYDHIAAAELQARLEAVENENARLRSIEQKLTELLERNLSPQAEARGDLSS